MKSSYVISGSTAKSESIWSLHFSYTSRFVLPQTHLSRSSFGIQKNITTPSIDLSTVPSSLIQPPPCSPFPHILRMKHSRSGFCAKYTCALPLESLRKRGKKADIVRQRNLLHSSKISFFACKPLVILSITIGFSLSNCWNFISLPL